MILYNGGTGGLGQYLPDALRSRGTVGTSLRARLEDTVALRQELKAIRPSEPIVFVQMAARVSVLACEADPQGTYKTNVLDTVATNANVLDWAEERSIAIRLIYVSTGHVYAALPRGSHATERTEIGPRSVYSSSKLAAEASLQSLALEREVPLLIARVFGLLAPRQAPSYVLPSLIDRVRHRRVADIPGLDHVRDYLDARDVCEDILDLSAVKWPVNVEVANICSGVPVSIRDLLHQVAVEVDAAAADELISRATAAPGRPDDIRWIVGDPAHFGSLTGTGTQRRSLAETVRDATTAS